MFRGRSLLVFVLLPLEFTCSVGGACLFELTCSGGEACLAVYWPFDHPCSGAGGCLVVTNVVEEAGHMTASGLGPVSVLRCAVY